MFNINILRKIAITTRKSIKLLILILLAAVVLTGLVVLFYNPTYEVSLNGEVIGFTTNKSELQERINGFTEENEEEPSGGSTTNTTTPSTNTNTQTPSSGAQTNTAVNNT